MIELEQDDFKYCITQTQVPGYSRYAGKVRDVYDLGNGRKAFVASDRISAFDHILPKPIPYKGQILNLIAKHFFNYVGDIVKTHIISVPHPNVTIGISCDPIPIEIIVRSVLVGHAWRVYRQGKRTLCGVTLPDGMQEYDQFDQPILTPSTKASQGHDEDISEEEILEQGILSEKRWNEISTTAFQLFNRGQQIAGQKGLLLADTKYEFGFYGDELILIDEVHTPDSSRYFYLEGFDEIVKSTQKPRQLSKEFVREWLMEHGFQGEDGEQMPVMDEAFQKSVYNRYAELYCTLTGKVFKPHSTADFHQQLSQILSEAAQGNL